MKNVTLLSIALLIPFAALSQPAATYPAAIPDWRQFGISTNNASTNLLNPITAGSSVLKVNSTAGFKAPTFVSVGTAVPEIIAICTISGNLMYVCPNGRQFDGTVAAAYPAGSKVERRPIANDHNRTAVELMAVLSMLGVNGSNFAAANHSHSLQALNGQVNSGQIAVGIDAAKIANGSVSNQEFQFLDGVTSSIQQQLNVIATATDQNTPSATVRRDILGGFSAGQINATFFGNLTGNVQGNLTGNVTGNVTGSAGVATNFTGTLTGDVTGGQSSTTVVSVGGSSAASVAAGALLANSATTANASGTIVRRDNFGNISASTASLLEAYISNPGNDSRVVINSGPGKLGQILFAESGLPKWSLLYAGGGFMVWDNVNSLAMVGIGPGTMQVYGSLTASSFSGPLSGTVTGSLIGNASTATRLANSPTGCSTGLFVSQIDAFGTPTCVAVSYANLVGVPTGYNAVSLQGVPLSSVTPANGNALIFNGSSGQYEPGTVAGGGGGGGAPTGPAGGDLGLSYPNPIVTTVGGATAANIASAATKAAAATATNTANTLVSRDASGNFSAGTITASLVGAVTGNVTGNVSGSSASFTGSLAGDVTGGQGSTVVNAVGGKTASAIASATLLVEDATAGATALRIARRDSSGNVAFNQVSATTFTGNLTGNVIGNASGTSAGFTGALSGDVTGGQGTTVVARLGARTAAQVGSLLDKVEAAAENALNQIVIRPNDGIIKGVVQGAQTVQTINFNAQIFPQLNSNLKEFHQTGWIYLPWLLCGSSLAATACDADANNVVDAADHAPWSGLTGAPAWTTTVSGTAAISDFNTITASGFYGGFNSLNAPQPSKYFGLLNLRGNEQNGPWAHQLAGEWATGSTLWSRSYYNTTYTPWQRVVKEDQGVYQITPSEHQMMFVWADPSANLTATTVNTVWRNLFGSTTLYEFFCESDSGNAVINFQRDDGSPADILTSNLTCPATGDFGTVSTTENGFGPGEHLDFKVVSGGTARRISVSIRYKYNY